MRRLWKKTLGLLVCAVIVLQAFSLCALAESGGSPVADGFEKVCENQKLALYLNPQNCFFAVEDKAAGKVLYSNPANAEQDDKASNRYKMELLAQFAFSYRKADEKDTTYLNSYTAAVRRENFTIDKDKTGFTVTYDLANVGIALPMSVRLAEDNIQVSVDFSGLNGLEAQINSLMLLPYFGSGDAGVSGYNFVPDGSGAIIRFNNSKIGTEGYKQWVYGNDPADEDMSGSFVGEKASLPVFGCQSDNGGFLGVIEGGAAQAAVQAYTAGSLTGFNNVYPAFTLIASNTLEVSAEVKNNVFGTDYLTDTVSVRYYPLGDKTGYAGMADIYREYLLENNLLPRQVETAPYGMLLETYGAVKKKQSVLGFPINVTKKLTSFEDCLEIVKAMEEKGISSINVEYNNWSKAGVSGKIDADPRPLSSIGGERGRKELDDYLSRNGGKAYLNVSALTFENGSMSASTGFDGIKKLGDIKVEEFPVKLNTLASDSSQKARRFLSYPKLDSVLNKMFTNFNKWGNRNIGFIDIGNTAYADFAGGQQMFRGQGIEKVNDILLSNRETYDSVLLRNANAYSFGYAGYISSLPTGSSGFSIVDESVPFMQMVLHGSVKYATPPVNMSPNPMVSLLKAIETGSELSFAWIYENPEILHGTSLNDLFGCDYRLWLDFAAESFRRANAALSGVANVRMTDHRRLAEGVYETVYENGTRIYVNYNDTDVSTQDGVVVKALDYTVKGEEAR